MTTFKEAAQARVSLKMYLSNYAWYNGSLVRSDGDDYCVVIHVHHLDHKVKKIIPIVHNGVSVRAEIVK